MACSSDDQTEGDESAETNLHMLEKEILCDVTFLAGKNEEPVRAHKFMLASRSPVFYAMFCGPLAESKEAVKVPDIEINVLKNVIRFIYTADCTLTGELVMATLYAAKKYEVESLVETCSEFLQSHIDDENVCTIFQQAITFDERNLMTQCLSHIFVNGESVLRSRSFLSLDRETLRRILESDELEVDELAIYKASVDWAKHQCSEAGLTTSDAKIRKNLGDLVYLIRFPIMSLQDFTVHVSQTDILTDTEKVSVFQSYSVERDTCNKFVLRKRSSKINAVFERFQEINCPWWHNSKASVFSFTCSRNVRLIGVFLFTPSTVGNVSGKLEIADDNMTLCTKEIFLIHQDGKTFEEVVLESPLELKKEKQFYLSQTCDGSPTYYGTNGKAELIEKNVTITFSRCSKNTCGTNDERSGQFYGLHLIYT